MIALHDGQLHAQNRKVEQPRLKVFEWQLSGQSGHVSAQDFAVVFAQFVPG